MASALNLTLKIKQTPENLAKLQHVKAIFATEIQPKIDKVLRDSEIVHYARVVVIGKDEYIQVITEYDGDERVYTEFFRQHLRDLFETVFSLGEEPLKKEQLDSPDEFAKFTNSKKVNLPSLGTDGGQGPIDHGYFFQAYPNVLVKEITAKFPSV